jgi:hypothetical protein
METPRTETHIFDGNPSFPESFLSPNEVSAATMNSVTGQSNASVNTASYLSQYAMPFNGTRPYPSPVHQISESSGDSSNYHSGDIALAAESFDYDLMGHGFDSETGQLFASECNFDNWERRLETPLTLSANSIPMLSRTGAGDWDIHRALITKMYSEEQKTLKEIMEFMDKEHRFKPSLVFAHHQDEPCLT